MTVLVSGVVKSTAQDAMPARVVPVQPMMSVTQPTHLNAGTAIDLENPASFLYPEWSNSYVNNYDNVKLPDSVIISMKGYCMPTDSTYITDKLDKDRRYHSCRI